LDDSFFEIAPQGPTTHLLYALGIATVPLVIAYGIAQVTEVRTAQVRQKVVALCHAVAPKAIPKN
jgi:hypothetical protein